MIGHRSKVICNWCKVVKERKEEEEERQGDSISIEALEKPMGKSRISVVEKEIKRWNIVFPNIFS